MTKIGQNCSAGTKTRIILGFLTRRSRNKSSFLILLKRAQRLRKVMGANWRVLDTFQTAGIRAQATPIYSPEISAAHMLYISG